MMKLAPVVVGGSSGPRQGVSSAIQRNVEPSPLDFKASGHLYATHSLHAFAARFPPPLVDWAITRFSKPGDVVLDPMMGSGTTLVEAGLLGRAAWGADIDPLARLIASAKATLVNPREVEDAADDVEELIEDGELDDLWRPELPDLGKWFRSEVSSDLARLRHAIKRVDCDDGVKVLMWAVFSSLIVARTSVANARDLVHSRHHYRAWQEDPRAAERFVERLRRASRLMEDFEDRIRMGSVPDPRAVIVGTDARHLPLGPASVDLIVTSPPYCSALDYTRAHMFAVAWMSDVLHTTVSQFRELGRTYIGSERAPLSQSPSRTLPRLFNAVDDVVVALGNDPKRAWIVYRYFRDMGGVILECTRLLRRGGHAVLVVCPSNIRKVPIPTHEIFKQWAPILTSGGLRVVEFHERTIHDGRRVMPYLESAFGPRMRAEYVLVLERSAKGLSRTRGRIGGREPWSRNGSSER